MMYRIVERYYKMGLFSLEKVKQSVTVKWITVDEYKEITGQDYEPLAE
ncbi:XkdX family protein [Staphylococcus haemolyticus]|nr:XkdX family protein [Staphylococcus haemolyticus]MCH4392919.1 XkdX family protein [Staphylococcus haemolyticus]